MRAWTIHVGDTAPQAAGVIFRTDFERRFIRAQTIAFADYVAFKGEHGKRRPARGCCEGKEYVVKDGDVLTSIAAPEPAVWRARPVIVAHRHGPELTARRRPPTDAALLRRIDAAADR